MSVFTFRHVGAWPLVVDGRPLDACRGRRPDCVQHRYGARCKPGRHDGIGLDYFCFGRQLVYLPVALALMIGASLLSPTGVFRAAMVTLTIFSLLVVATFVVGTEIKGARRWIGLGPISVQPSEF